MRHTAEDMSEPSGNLLFSQLLSKGLPAARFSVAVIPAPSSTGGRISWLPNKK